jgi:hypothetical protein
MRYFCTYFDRRFLPRALALHESLRAWGGEFRLWALCLDDESYRALEQLRPERVEPIRLADFERGDDALLEAKRTRTRVEYCFTCSPTLPLRVLERHPEVDQITYLDADLFFYADPQPIYDELGGASIGMIPHRFSKRVQDRARFGTYNVGWLSFRRDESGLACLRWWRERCLEWCYARLEGDRYADQKYLDWWPGLFTGVRQISHKGANLGPWNLANYRISLRDGRVYVDDDPLIFFHFSSFLPVASWMYNTNFASWHVRPSAVVRRHVVGPYIEALRTLPRLPAPSAPAGAAETGPPEGPIQRLARKGRAVRRILGGLVVQDHLVVLRGRVL